jgi:hypothetical protein
MRAAISHHTPVAKANANEPQAWMPSAMSNVRRRPSVSEIPPKNNNEGINEAA